jgi:hypothetical protein
MDWRRVARPFVLAAMLGAAALGLHSAAESQDNFSLEAAPGSGVPEVIFYHGMVLDKNLREIPPTIDNVSFVLRRYTEALASHSSPAAYARLADMQKTALAPEMDKTDELLRSVAMARWLLKNNDYQQKDSLEPMLGALEVWATIPTREGIDAQLRNNLQLAPMLAAMDLEIQQRDAPDEPETTDYMKECMREQVPIPPDWGDRRWVFRRHLDPNYSFVADSDSIAEVWTYVDPNVPGLCVGLPRKDKETKDIGLFGIICQSKTTGKACFWDNVDRFTHRRMLPEQSKRLKIAAVEGGSQIVENCTNCHRGKNVFVIHPRTALDLPEKEFAIDHDVEWYSPISGQKTWGNPGPMQGLSSCKGCHPIPELAANNNDLSTNPPEASPYCRILEQVVNKTMPPGGAPAGWLNPQSHHRDVGLLRTKCKELGLE